MAQRKKNKPNITYMCKISGVSKLLDVNFVLDTVNQLIEKHVYLLTENTLVHSDQGCHYISISYQESFFGHMKDELHLKECLDYGELLAEIDDYMNYYNNYRYQWDLEKRNKVEYRIYLLEVENSLLQKKEAESTNVQSASI